MTEQFDEGVMDIMRSVGLAALIGSVATYGVKAINKELEKSMAPSQEKIQALQQAATQTSDPVAKQAIKQAAVLVKPNKPLPSQHIQKRSSDEDIISRAKPYITQHEIYGTDIYSKSNAKFLTVRPDDAKAGNPTIGIGHKVLPGDPTSITPKQALAIFDRDIRLKYSDIKRIFAPVWNKLSDDQKIALLDAHFRGEIKSTYKWPVYLKKGLFKRAAAEYLNSAELKERQATGRGGSVAKRNRSNSLIFSGKAKISDFIDGKV
jgi:hypothetical protein